MPINWRKLGELFGLKAAPPRRPRLPQRPGPDVPLINDAERRFFELTGKVPTTARMRARDQAAHAQAREPFDTIRAQTGMVTLDELQQSDALTPGSFLKADGLIFATASGLKTVPYLHEHRSYAAQERMENVGTMIVGEKSLLVFDLDGSVQVGARYEELGGRKIDRASTLEQLGFLPLHEEELETQRLKDIVREDSVVFGRQASAVPGPEEVMNPSYAVHAESMPKMGRPVLSQAEFDERVKFRGRTATAVHKPKPGGGPSGTGM